MFIDLMPCLVYLFIYFLGFWFFRATFIKTKERQKKEVTFSVHVYHINNQ